MPINIQDYLLGRIPVGRKIDIPAYLMAKAAGGRIQEITGTLPLYVRSRASQILKNYIIYGTASGTGVETENLFNGNGAYIRISKNSTAEFQSGTLVVSNGYGVYFDIDITTNTNYSIKVNPQDSTDYLAFTAVLLPSNTRIIGFRPTLVSSTFNSGSDNKIQMEFYSGRSASSEAYSVYSDIMLTKSSTVPSSYIPYGYKLPITVTSNGTTTDYPIYIGSTKLGEEEYVDYAEQKVYKNINIFNKDTAERYELAKRAGFNAVTYFFGGAMFFFEAVQNADYTLKVESNTAPSILRLYRSDNPLQHLTSETTSIAYTEEKEAISGENTVSINSGNSKYIWIQFGANWWGQESSTATILFYTLQPTDPPVPLPDITLPQGIATIDTEEEFKYTTSIKGKIEQI